MEEVDLKRRAQADNLTLVRRELPGDNEVEAKVAERLRVMLEEKYRSQPNSIKERLGRFIPLSKELAGGEEEMHVVAMLFDMFYQDTLHKPLYPREREAVRKPRVRRSRPRTRSGGPERPRRSQRRKRR
jgi:hypothetical protein